jgi:hypothetical protein
MRAKIAILLLCGGVLAVFVSCQKAGSNDAESNAGDDEVALWLSDNELKSLVGEESARHAKRSCRKLDIAESVQVKDAKGYWDGGSRDLTLIDAKGVEYKFKIWHGFHGPMDIARSDREGKPERVELAGPEEQDLYGVLLRWIPAHPRRDALLGKQDLDPVKDRVLAEASQFYARMRRRVVPQEADIAPQPNGSPRKRGQVQFAGTALRVLRTNWTCPLFLRPPISSKSL